MSAQDLRDVMGLTGHVARPPPLKKQKTVGQRARTLTYLTIVYILPNQTLTLVTM